MMIMHAQGVSSWLLSENCWLPPDPRGQHLVPAGHHIDAVKVPHADAPAVLSTLHTTKTAWIEDLADGSHLWLVPAGSIPSTPSPTQNWLVLSLGWHITIPGISCTTRRRWRGLPPALAPVDALTAALLSAEARLA